MMDIINGRVIPIEIREKIADKISLMKENKNSTM